MTNFHFLSFKRLRPPEGILEVHCSKGSLTVRCDDNFGKGRVCSSFRIPGNSFVFLDSTLIAWTALA